MFIADSSCKGYQIIDVNMTVILSALPLEVSMLHPAVTILSSSIRNIQTPGLFTLLVLVIFMIADVLGTRNSKKTDSITSIESCLSWSPTKSTFSI